MTSNKYAGHAAAAHASASAEKLSISFEYLDLTMPEYFVHGLEAAHYQKLFECLHTISSATEDQITQQTHPSLVPKSIFNQIGTHDRFPEEIERRIAMKIKGEKRAGGAQEKGSGGKSLTDEELTAVSAVEAKRVISKAFEVRISKAYGRLHGIVWNKAFHVIWIDPAHNLYPLSTHGVRLHHRYATVQGYGPENVAALQAENRSLADRLNKLQLEHDELFEAYAESNAVSVGAN